MSARKTIHLIRHAQSAHNERVLELPDEDIARFDPALRDAPLTELGHRQAQALADDVAAQEDIELVVTSPLTRAIQTTLTAFGDHPAPRIVAALHREHQDSFCDIGRSPAHLAAEFPMLDFDHLDDPWWHVDPTTDGPFLRETLECLSMRVAAFSDWLRARPEECIAVVGHGTFLRTLSKHRFANAERIVIRL